MNTQFESKLIDNQEFIKPRRNPANAINIGIGGLNTIDPAELGGLRSIDPAEQGRMDGKKQVKRDKDLKARNEAFMNELRRAKSQGF
jgi:hypothetical protein